LLIYLLTYLVANAADAGGSVTLYILYSN